MRNFLSCAIVVAALALAPGTAAATEEPTASACPIEVFLCPDDEIGAFVTVCGAPAGLCIE